MDEQPKVQWEKFECNLCPHTYDFKQFALQCEKDHEKNQDKWWIELQSRLERMKLDRAASHPKQVKLQ